MPSPDTRGGLLQGGHADILTFICSKYLNMSDNTGEGIAINNNA